MDWHDLIEDVRIELGLLRQLADESADLVAAVKARRDGPTDHLAAGAVLQSFYNGVEKAMMLIAERADGGWDRGENARQALLEAMCRPTDNRAAVLGDELADALRRYMEFREAFRYAQFFHLDWGHTAPLVADLPQTLDVFETRLDEFLTAAAGEPARLTDEPAELPRYWSQPVKVKAVRLEKRPAVVMCVVAVAIGAITSFIMVKRHYGPWKPQVMPPSMGQHMFKDPSFIDPDGRTVTLTLRDEKEPFLVTVGRIVEKSTEPFTGRIVRKGPTPRSRPALGLTFHEGKPIFCQAVTDTGEFERGYFRNGRLMRLSLCRADGLPYRTHHLTSGGRTACVIDRGQFLADDVGGSGYAGWYYRFYHEGRQAAELFMTDDGLLLKSDVWGIDTDMPQDGNDPAPKPGGKTQ